MTTQSVLSTSSPTTSAKPKSLKRQAHKPFKHATISWLWQFAMHLCILAGMREVPFYMPDAVHVNSGRKFGDMRPESQVPARGVWLCVCKFAQPSLCILAHAVRALWTGLRARRLKLTVQARRRRYFESQSDFRKRMESAKFTTIRRWGPLTSYFDIWWSHVTAQPSKPGWQKAPSTLDLPDWPTADVSLL